MSSLLTLALALAAQLPGQPPAGSVRLEGGFRSPAISRDGKLAFELRGDVWIAPAGSPEAAVRVTSGTDWDGEPAWTPDGSALVFASNRGGELNLWRMALRPGLASGTPERLTRSPQPERQPVVAPDGSVVFVRGAGPLADLWVRSADGEERQLTREAGGDHSPTVSADGTRVVYVQDREGRRRLVVRELAGESERVIVRDQPVAFPSWAPDGARIAYATLGDRPGVWITPTDGRYTNLVSEQRAAPAWSPDGRKLVLAELPGDEPGYNGDPMRGGDRDISDVFPFEGRLWTVEVPAAPDAGIAPVGVRAEVSGAEYNLQVFDRAWERIRDLYFADARSAAARKQWEGLRSRYRAQAASAQSERELEEVVHAMLRERPTYLPEASGRSAVSSAHPLATEAGLEMLRLGGNVVDAAVAVSFALGVVEPDASGIGGYGQMVVYMRGMREPTVIDFLTRVPEEATLDNAGLLINGRLPSDGPVVANVPGTVAGMWLAWKRFGSGKLQWAQLLEPAIRYAEQGFVIDESFGTTLARERDRFAKYPSSRELFFRDGDPLQPGETLRNPDLAWTLRQIAQGGADAFYRGEVARRMVADLRGKGNAMSLTDLARYYAPEYAPVRTTYQGYTVFSGAPATTGGVTLAGRLNLLELASPGGSYPEDAATLHAMIEAMKLAPSTSGRIADPGLWPVNLEPFLSKDTARARWECFRPQQASRSPRPARGEDEPAAACEREAQKTALEQEQETHCAAEPASAVHRCRATGTTSYVVGDADGNLVAVTQTLGTWGGNFYVSPGLGFLYNDKLGSYPTDPTVYGARLPYARNSTIITPTLVFRGTGPEAQPLAAVGAAGNAWISSAVYQAVVGMLDFDLGPQRALELPRFLLSQERRPDGGREAVIQYEDAIAPGVLETLRGFGHKLQPISLKGELRMGYGAALRLYDGEVRAGADPRRSGEAGAVK